MLVGEINRAPRGEPAESEGVAERRWAVDGRCSMLEEASYDRAGALVGRRSAAPLHRYELDALGKRVSEACVGVLASTRARAASPYTAESELQGVGAVLRYIEELDCAKVPCVK